MDYFSKKLKTFEIQKSS